MKPIEAQDSLVDRVRGVGETRWDVLARVVVNVVAILGVTAVAIAAINHIGEAIRP